MLGVFFVILSIAFLMGAVFEMSMLRENQKQQDENEDDLSYSDEQKEEEDDEMVTQTIYTGIFCGLFLIFLVVGGILMVCGNPIPVQQTIIYQQAPDQEPMPQSQPPIQPQQQPGTQPSGFPCPSCNENVHHDWNLCPKCGAKLQYINRLNL